MTIEQLSESVFLLQQITQNQQKQIDILAKLVAELVKKPKERISNVP